MINYTVLPRVLVSTEAAYTELYDVLSKASVIAIDVETEGPKPEDGLNPWKGWLVGVGFATQHYNVYKDTYFLRSYYLPMYVRDSTYTGAEWLPYDLNQLLQATPKKAMWLMHNAKFDMKWLELNTAYRWDDMSLLRDPMLEMWLINSSEPKGLKDLTKKFFPGEPEPVKFEKLLGIGKNKKKLSEIPPEYIADYCCADAINTLRIHWHTEDLLAAEGENVQTIYEHLELPILRLLADMELRGVQVNRPALDKLNIMLTEEIELAEKKLKDYADINWNSPQQVVKVLEAAGVRLPKDKVTATGKQQLTAEVLDMLEDDIEIVQTLKEFKGMSKLLKTYIHAYYNRMDEKNRVHAEFRQAGTRTGRLSCGEINLQNIPRPRKAKPGETLSKLEKAYTALREILVANTHGWLDLPMFVADLSQIELRMATHFSGDPVLTKAYFNDDDIHQITADEIANGDRQVAKSVNFGYLYGIGPRKLMLGVKCTLNEAKVFLARYEKLFAGLRMWTQRVQAKARMDGYVETILGRKRYLPDIKSADQAKASAAARQAVNTLVQGSAADYLKIAMLNIEKQLEPYGVQTILQVHDELVWQSTRSLKKEQEEKVKDIIKKGMENALTLRVPVRTEVKTVQNWAEAK